MEAGWESLADAIIMQAVRDYRIALKRRPRRFEANPNNTVEECERFFKSGFFMLLTEARGEYLILKMKEEIKR